MPRLTPELEQLLTNIWLDQGATADEATTLRAMFDGRLSMERAPDGYETSVVQTFGGGTVRGRSALELFAREAWLRERANLRHGGDPVHEVYGALEARGYSRAEIDAVYEGRLVRRAEDGTVIGRAYGKPIEGPEAVRVVAKELGERIDAARGAPELEAHREALLAHDRARGGDSIYRNF